MIGHSPLGASGSHRWLVCPGSVGLSAGVHDEESDHAALGTAAHALAASCLGSNTDAWERIGAEIDGFPADKDMADAVQVYLDAVRKLHPDRSQGNTFIERAFHCPEIHELFYGTTDLAYVEEDDAPSRNLHVWDYKHGAGIVVEVKNNPQLMYYGCGAIAELDLHDQVDNVVFHIAQPRGFHSDGPIREWSISVDKLLDWQDDVLVPAMDRAMVSRDTASGEHCRFCPVRARACPQLLADADELEKMMHKGTADELTNEQIARFLDLGDTMKIAVSAANKTAFNRLQAGHAIPGRKLVKAKANRVWKEGAEAAIKAKFGADAFDPATLKSPAQIEKLPEGEGYCARWAQKPDAGLTIGKGEDARPGVSKETKSLFTAATKQRKKG